MDKQLSADSDRFADFFSRASTTFLRILFLITIVEHHSFFIVFSF
jgi:hypothetical protein